LAKYISFLKSTILNHESEYDNYYDYSNMEDFIIAKNNLLDEYKNKYFRTWPIYHDWVHSFIASFWRNNHDLNKTIKLVWFTKDKNKLLKLKNTQYTYVLCKQNDFTKAEIDFLLLTFYKNQKNIKLFSLNYLKENESDIFKSLLLISNK
jgi:hypothetical protein